MKIKCSREEWDTLEMLMNKYFSTSTDYSLPKFICFIYDTEDQFIFDIDGEFENEI